MRGGCDAKLRRLYFFGFVSLFFFVPPFPFSRALAGVDGVFIPSTPRGMMPGSKLEQQPEELVRVLDNHGHRDARAEVLASTWAGGWMH